MKWSLFATETVTCDLSGTNKPIRNSELTIIRDAADFFTSSWPNVVLASVSPFRPLRTAVNTFICTASWREDLAWRIHSAKWSNICKRCLLATRGKIWPNKDTDMSITATPNGSGPGSNSPCTKITNHTLRVTTSFCCKVEKNCALLGYYTGITTTHCRAQKKAVITV